MCKMMIPKSRDKKRKGRRGEENKRALGGSSELGKTGVHSESQIHAQPHTGVEEQVQWAWNILERKRNVMPVDL